MDALIPAWVDGRLRPYDKIAVHVEGLRHKAVSVFVLSGDHVLIQRRSLGKYHTPGLWANTCCTHPHWDEAPDACAVRRLREELGIESLNPIFADQIEYRADVGGGMIEHEVVDVFVAKASRDLAWSPNPAEVMDVRWIGLAELLDEVKEHANRFTPWLRIYLDRHRDRIFGAAA
ncbi:Isopentenyl-diphosphate Delta-isomerase [Defluviimonas aquaemixtae]|uniref:Isopentenyl-diphosphate Delta-isomerase n=1 Tax=Albidovulum aquaemixtae TaxID=1542388 RepID=A0A2R8BJP3_9RHOB|nr:isopentenyl-diphosphate Delta-isomerase [Defluviimonas aquaemixtae]SPH23532.1 Isopentenyl-diphosphate Delta-isomerase [Defluviimonas aquaemixtae]